MGKKLKQKIAQLDEQLSSEWIKRNKLLNAIDGLRGQIAALEKRGAELLSRVEDLEGRPRPQKIVHMRSTVARGK